MSAKMAISSHDVTNKILSPDVNCDHVTKVW